MALEFKNNGLGLILGIVILILVGIALIDPLATSLAGMDDTSTGLTEAITVASGSSTTGNDDVVSIQAFWNNTPFIVTVTDADINFTQASGIVLTNVSVADGSYFINYTYQPDTFVDDPTSRTILNATIILFFALAILIGVIGWFMRSGIQDFLNNR